MINCLPLIIISVMMKDSEYSNKTKTIKVPTDIIIRKFAVKLILLIMRIIRIKINKFTLLLKSGQMVTITMLITSSARNNNENSIE